MVVALGVVLIVLGIFLLALDFLVYAKKKLTEGFGLVWALLGGLIFVAGIVLVAADQITKMVWVVAMALVVILTFFLFGVSRVVSVLEMKNQELAMQVSLLNQENESILRDLNKLKENQDGQKGSLRN